MFLRLKTWAQTCAYSHLCNGIQTTFSSVVKLLKFLWLYCYSFPRFDPQFPAIVQAQVAEARIPMHLLPSSGLWADECIRFEYFPAISFSNRNQFAICADLSLTLTIPIDSLGIFNDRRWAKASRTKTDIHRSRGRRSIRDLESRSLPPTIYVTLTLTALGCGENGH